MSKKQRKYFTPEEREEQVVSVDGKQDYRATVHEDLSGSIQKEVILQRDYSQQREIPGNLNQGSQGYTQPQYNRSEGRTDYGTPEIQRTEQGSRYQIPAAEQPRRETAYPVSQPRYPAAEQPRTDARYPENPVIRQTEDRAAQLLHPTGEGSVIHQRGSADHQQVIHSEPQYTRPEGRRDYGAP